MGLPSPWVADISIHAPREGCDLKIVSYDPHTCIFQSTHPVRGATSWRPITTVRYKISIHAPREGCDTEAMTLAPFALDFNPRTP